MTEMMFLQTVSVIERCDGSDQVKDEVQPVSIQTNVQTPPNAKVRAQSSCDVDVGMEQVEVPKCRY